jgi:cation diffusion facilitator family transporter
LGDSDRLMAVTDCCEVRADIPERQRRVLQIVLWINVAMFLAEFVAGLMGRSTALLADSADMLGDSIVYGFSLYVVRRGTVWRARAALLKGVIMAAFGLGVLGEVAVKFAQGLLPTAAVMGGVGFLALAANTVVVLILWRRRGDDINMRSAWLCSRNDVIANGGVLFAAAGVAVTGTAWPDILIGLLIAGMFATSATDVIRSARRELASASAQ